MSRVDSACDRVILLQQLTPCFHPQLMPQDDTVHVEGPSLVSRRCHLEAGLARPNDKSQSPEDGVLRRNSPAQYVMAYEAAGNAPWRGS